MFHCPEVVVVVGLPLCHAERVEEHPGGGALFKRQFYGLSVVVVMVVVRRLFFYCCYCVEEGGLQHEVSFFSNLDKLCEFVAVFVGCNRWEVRVPSGYVEVAVVHSPSKDRVLEGADRVPEDVLPDELSIFQVNVGEVVVECAVKVTQECAYRDR